MMRSFLAKHRFSRPSQLFNSPVFGRDKLAETGTLGYQEKKLSELCLDKSPARKCWNIAIPWVAWFGDTMFGHVRSWTLSIYIYIMYIHIHEIQFRFGASLELQTGVLLCFRAVGSMSAILWSSTKLSSWKICFQAKLSGPSTADPLWRCKPPRAPCLVNKYVLQTFIHDHSSWFAIWNLYSTVNHQGLQVKHNMKQTGRDDKQWETKQGCTGAPTLLFNQCA